MPHESARRRIRRELAHHLKENDGPERRAPSSLEVSGLLKDMIKNNISKFGLVRLAAWHLDVLVTSGELMCELELPIDSDGPLTLLEAACLMPNRDKFIGALLRAGCDPTFTIEWGEDAICSCKDAKEVIARLQPMTAVWVVKQVVQMRHRRLKGEGSTVCQYCHTTRSSLRSCLSWPCERHFCCEACFWKILSQMQDRGECIDPAFNCNSCHQLDPAPNDVLLSHNSMEDAIKIKTESKERWLKLPLHPLSHEKHSRQQMGSRPKAFEARPASEVARLFVGGTRSQRQQRLFDAALEGNVERIRALIEAGADIDARNEMGMTPIFISSMYGHLSAVKLLLSAGADLSITSNGGSSCLDAAVAQEHHDVAMLIRTELGCDSPAPNVAPVSPWEAEQPPRASVEILIPSSSNHPGAGAFLVDNAVTRAEMDQLESLFHRLGSGAGFSTENSQYYTCDVERRHFSDSERWVSCLLSLILERAKAVSCLPELTSPGDPLPFMRFLHYNQPMSSMKPHIDLSKKVPDPRGDREKARRRSKYTFLLYLSSGPDDGGGETLLLEREAPTLEACGQVLASIRPIKGRLIVYPHKCPHAGAEVLNPPKILLRGEFY